MFVGLDAHNDSIDIATAFAPRDGDVGHLALLRGLLPRLPTQLNSRIEELRRTHRWNAAVG